jgi:hypothetical protein
MGVKSAGGGTRGSARPRQRPRARLVIDWGRPDRVIFDGRAKQIRFRAWTFLVLLAEYPRKVVPYRVIHNRVWGSRGLIVEDNQVHFQLRSLRDLGIPLRCVSRCGVMLDLAASAVRVEPSPFSSDDRVS